MRSIPPYPRRIVCLAAEVPEILDRLGAMDRVVAVSGFTRRPPAARELPKVGGFANPNIEKILSLQPDLVIAISDIQAEAAAALIRKGLPVLALNPHRLDDVWRNILMIGGALGLQQEAEALAVGLQNELAQMAAADRVDGRPRVYFEEWHDPMISGIGWVSDLIEHLGAEDIFRDRANGSIASERFVSPMEVVERQPDLIVASWCGKKADLDAIRQRPGWAQISAVRRNQVHEIASHHILQTGPGLLEGARQLGELLVKAKQGG